MDQIALWCAYLFQVLVRTVVDNLFYMVYDKMNIQLFKHLEETAY